MPAPLTPFQARAALHLARAHHHLWTSLHDVPDEQVISWLVTGDYASLSAACLAQGQGQPGGIDITVDVRDHIFSYDLLNVRQNTQNLELTTGIAYYF